MFASWLNSAETRQNVTRRKWRSEIKMPELTASVPMSSEINLKRLLRRSEDLLPSVDTDPHIGRILLKVLVH